MSGPNNVVVGERFSLSVSVTNAGGQSGEFADALTVGGDADVPETRIRIADVASSEARTVETGPFSLGHAGDYRFELAETGASHVVSVSGRSLRGGEQFALDDGPAVGLMGLSPHSGLFYDTANGRVVLAPDPDSVLVTVEASVENRGNSQVRVAPEDFSVAEGEVLAALPRNEGDLTGLDGIDGDPFARETIEPDEAQTGWLLAEVPRERATAGPEFAWNRTRTESETRNETVSPAGEDADESETTVGGETNADSTTADGTSADGDSIPEARWRFDPVELPRFEVTELQMLGEVEFGESVTVTVAVENTGSVAGTYRGGLEHRYADATDWHPSETLELDLSPGSSATRTTEIEPPEPGTARYRLRPGSAAASVDVHPATRTLAESFTTPEGARLRAELGNDHFDGLLASYIYDAGGNETYRAPPGKTFAFVSVTAENTATESVEFPDATAFSVAVDGESYSVFHQSSDDGDGLASPVDGRFYAPESESEPGATHTGWLVFQVPDDASTDELSVRCSSDGDAFVSWSA
ncbi:DUF4352 domain-containing protein [Halorussus aquaticus]|uniref:DUF4352 domain-containing protein n=1 Tax=Halorussus aquaticus TaxID=2953748 RepID=A0ABD5Q514_9EURY|nr:DUF4352 domain-containing protein [Halorussus aquaticus]